MSFSTHFTHAITRRPASSITRGLRAVDTGTPDLGLMQAHHAAYIATLRETGATVVELPALDAYPDSVFVEDTARSACRKVRSILRPGAPSRLGEAAEMAPHLRALYRDVVAITGTDCFIEGGDILVTEREILVGRSARAMPPGSPNWPAWSRPGAMPCAGSHTPRRPAFQDRLLASRRRHHPCRRSASPPRAALQATRSSTWRTARKPPPTPSASTILS